MRFINFPQDQSVGEVLIGEGHNSTDWDEAVEAKGTIIIPDNKYVSFWLGHRLSLTDLDFLNAIKPDDLDEFVAASSYFNDSNFEKVLHLSNLNSLQLWETEITDESLKLIPTFSKLRHIGIDTTKITDAGLAHLSEIAALKTISAYHNDISGECLAHFTKLNLTELDLADTNISDSSIIYLKQMKSLKYLRIYQTKISENGFLELEGSLPDCKIRFYTSNDL